MKQDFIKNEMIVLSKQTLDLFLEQKNSKDLIAVYVFYYFTAKWQKTNQPWCADKFVMMGLKMGKKTFSEAKKFLMTEHFISKVPARDRKGKITKWYVKLNYIWKQSSIPEMEIDQSPQNPPSGEQETNALSANTVNALNANNITDSPDLAKQEVVSKSLVGNLPSGRGKTPIERVLSIYRDLFIDTYGFEPEIPIGRFGKTLNSLLKTKTELQISALLICFFNWAGMTGNDNFERDKLIKATHSPFWFFSTVNTYEAWLRNVHGLKFDDEGETREFVAKYMRPLKEKLSNSNVAV